jgi:hypothetical protein
MTHQIRQRVVGREALGDSANHPSGGKIMNAWDFVQRALMKYWSPRRHGERNVVLERVGVTQQLYNDLEKYFKDTRPDLLGGFRLCFDVEVGDRPWQVTSAKFREPPPLEDVQDVSFD